MRKTITIISAIALTLVSGGVASPAMARNNTATAILGVVAGTGLGLAIRSGQNRQPYGYTGGGYYQQPQAAYVPVPQPRPAPNGITCMAWNGFDYVPVQRCGN